MFIIISEINEIPKLFCSNIGKYKDVHFFLFPGSKAKITLLSFHITFILYSLFAYPAFIGFK